MKNCQDFCPHYTGQVDNTGRGLSGNIRRPVEKQQQHRTEILTIFCLYFGRNDDFINSFWNCLTFRTTLQMVGPWTYLCYLLKSFTKIWLGFYPAPKWNLPIWRGSSISSEVLVLLHCLSPGKLKQEEKNFFQGHQVIWQ